MRSRSIIIAGLAVALATSAAPVALASPGDRDGDRMPDRWERSHGLSTRYDDSARDPDRDRLSNYREYRSHTDPRKHDSDRDGVHDAYEDSDDDGVRNRDEGSHSHERHSDREQRGHDDDHGVDD